MIKYSRERASKANAMGPIRFATGVLMATATITLMYTRDSSIKVTEGKNIYCIVYNLKKEA